MNAAHAHFLVESTHGVTSAASGRHAAPGTALERSAAAIVNGKRTDSLTVSSTTVVRVDTTPGTRPSR